METFLFLIIIGVISALFKGTQKNLKESTAWKRPFSVNQPDFQAATKKIKTMATGKAAAPKQQEAAILPGNGTETKKCNDRAVNQDQKEFNLAQLKEQDAKQPSVLPEQKTLADAIIWSEILGEPRAKKPHFTRRF